MQSVSIKQYFFGTFADESRVSSDLFLVVRLFILAEKAVSHGKSFVEDFDFVHFARKPSFVFRGRVFVEPRVLVGPVQFGAAVFDPMPRVHFRAKKKRRREGALVTHFGTRVNVKAHVVKLQGWDDSRESASEIDFPQGGVGTESEKVKVGIVEEIDGRHAGRKNVDDADGDQATVNVVVLMIRTERMRVVAAVGGEKRRVA